MGRDTKSVVLLFDPLNRTGAMTKLAIITAIVAAGIVSPAFAQSFDPDVGTGNTVAFAYQPIAAHRQISVRESGLRAYARVPQGNADVGTGSAGYQGLLSAH
jgi:hypothetical protein